VSTAANVCTCPNGTPTVANGSAATLCENDGNVDCSACNPGYMFSSAVAGNGSQTCVSASTDCPEVCSGASVVVSHSPDHTIVACKDLTENTCESDFGSFCGNGYTWCTAAEFNARNDGWSFGGNDILSSEQGYTHTWGSDITKYWNSAVWCNDQFAAAACCADGLLAPGTCGGNVRMCGCVGACVCVRR
jgi:hypothetical protein